MGLPWAYGIGGYESLDVDAWGPTQRSREVSGVPTDPRRLGRGGRHIEADAHESIHSAPPGPGRVPGMTPPATAGRHFTFWHV